MKHIITTLIYLGLFLFTLWTVGCTQVIHTAKNGATLKVNTLFKSVWSDGAYYDPNGFFEIDGYKGIPSDIALEFDPLTKSFKFKTEN